MSNTGIRPTHWVSSVLLLSVAFVLDVVTPASLVVSILFNIPIALSGRVLRRNFTVWLVVLAVILNGMAGYLNRQITLEDDSIALLNRLLSTLSFVLVGFLTLQLRSSVARAAHLALEEIRASKERNLRQLLTLLSQTHSPEAFLDLASKGLCNYLGARAVVIVGLEHQKNLTQKYALPRYSSSVETLLAQVGSTVPDIAANLEVIWLHDPEHEFRVLVEASQHPEYLENSKNSKNSTLEVVQDALSAVEPIYQQLVLRGQLQAQKLELERSSDLIRDLIYAFSHDLRTPLLASSLNMKLALDGVYGPLSSEYRQSLHNGLVSNQALLSLAEQLLTVAKLEAGEVTSELKPLELSGLLEGRIQAVGGLYAEKGIRLESRLNPNIWVHGDKNELGRVVQNLLENAYKWSPAGATIQIRLERSGHYAQVLILDSGPGVPEAVRRTLFQRFKQAGPGAGSGLGLYLARRIVEAHGGHIAYLRVQAESQFSFTLPIIARSG